MSAKYLYNLAQYKVTLKQRNAYLKQLKYGQARDTVYLDVLTEQLAQFGAAVAVARAELLANMGQFAGVIHHDITRGGEELQLRYETQIDDQALQSEEATTKDLLAQYQQARSRELDQGTTLVGPHRDDIEFIVNDRNVAVYGSQGQQRTAALAVKLAEIDLMKQETGEYPVLLLDDVLSELDDSRQTHLLKAIQDKVQTFLTTTSLDGIAREIIQAPNVLRVQAGTLEAAGND